MIDSTRHERHRRTLWFGFLGGALAWLAHLLVSYAIGEFGCLTWLAGVRLLGITGVAWALIVTSLATAAVAAAAAVAPFRMTHGQEPLTVPERELLRVAWITSAIFFLIILFETVPTFYFLKDC